MVAIRLQARSCRRTLEAASVRLQAALWWTIVARSTEPRHAALIEQAHDYLTASKLDDGERELVRTKAARCLASNYADCD